MNGQRPVSVTAVGLHIKPDVYPKVEDEATIIVKYPKAQAILQASWNWPFDRKDMEVYGKTGQVFTVAGNDVKVRLPNQRSETQKAGRPSPRRTMTKLLISGQWSSRGRKSNRSPLWKPTLPSPKSSTRLAGPLRKAKLLNYRQHGRG